MKALEVCDIRKSFGETEVLKGVSFSLEKGEVLVIIVSSGSGKTTLLRSLNFLEKPDSGTITVNGETVLDAEKDAKIKDRELRKRRLHFGLVFQSFNLFPQHNVLKNVSLAPILYRDKALRSELFKRAVRKQEHEKIKEEDHDGWTGR